MSRQGWFVAKFFTRKRLQRVSQREIRGERSLFENGEVRQFLVDDAADFEKQLRLDR